MIHKVYEPLIRVLLGTAAHFCEASDFGKETAGVKRESVVRVVHLGSSTFHAISGRGISQLGFPPQPSQVERIIHEKFQLLFWGLGYDNTCMPLAHSITLKPRVEWYTTAMSLKYAPDSEPLHISVAECFCCRFICA